MPAAAALHCQAPLAERHQQARPGCALLARRALRAPHAARKPLDGGARPSLARERRRSSLRIVALAARAAKRAAKKVGKVAKAAFSSEWARRMRATAFAFKPGCDPLFDNEAAVEDGEEDGEEEGEEEEDLDLNESWTRRLRFDGGDGPGGDGPGAGLVA